MTDLNEMVNAAVTITVAGKKYKVRKLALEDLFAAIEGLVISQKITQMQQVAECLHGEEKVAYLRQCTGDLPSGELLQIAVTEMMGSIIGIRHILFMAMKTDQPDLKEEDVRGMVTADEADRLGSIVEWLCGAGSFPEEDTEGQKKTKKHSMRAKKPRA